MCSTEPKNHHTGQPGSMKGVTRSFRSFQYQSPGSVSVYCEQCHCGHWTLVRGCKDRSADRSQGQPHDRYLNRLMNKHKQDCIANNFPYHQDSAKRREVPRDVYKAGQYKRHRLKHTIES